MFYISRSREHLAVNLRTYGEDELATRVHDLTDQEMLKIGEVAASNTTESPLLAKAVTLAAVEVMEGKARPLKWGRRRLKGIYPGS